MKFLNISCLIICIVCNINDVSADSGCPSYTQNECSQHNGCYWYTGTLSSGCGECPSGYYCTNGTKSQCSDDYISNDKASSCTKCPDGYASTGHISCQNRAISTYSANTIYCGIQNNTKPFYEGYLTQSGFSISANASSCPCMPGTYWSNGTCNTCETNSVSCGQNSNTNPTICLSCPNGYSTNDNITCINNSDQNQKCIMVLDTDNNFKLKNCKDPNCDDTTDTNCGVCEDYQYKQLNSCHNCEPQGYYCDGTTITACPFGRTNSATDHTQRIGCSSCNTKITNLTTITVKDNYNNNSTNLQNITLSYYGTCPDNEN